MLLNGLFLDFRGLMGFLIEQHLQDAGDNNMMKLTGSLHLDLGTIIIGGSGGGKDPLKFVKQQLPKEYEFV